MTDRVVCTHTGQNGEPSAPRSHAAKGGFQSGYCLWWRFPRAKTTVCNVSNRTGPVSIPAYLHPGRLFCLEKVQNAWRTGSTFL